MSSTGSGLILRRFERVLAILIAILTACAKFRPEILIQASAASTTAQRAEALSYDSDI